MQLNFEVGPFNLTL